MSESRRAGATGVPAFRDEREAAAFWDTHSPLDYPEEFEEVTVSVDRPVSGRRLTVELSEPAIEQLKEIASDQGIGPAALARGWILEHLSEYEGSKAS